MKTPFQCERKLYLQHYGSQRGAGAGPYFQGRVRQNGYGLGSIFSAFARSAMPFLKKHAMPLLKRAGRGAVQTGVQVLEDVLEGKRLKDSLKRRSRDTLKRNLTEMRSRPTTKKRKIVRKQVAAVRSVPVRKKRHRKKAITHREDIFH